MAVAALWFGAPTTHPVSLARRLTRLFGGGVVEPSDLAVAANPTPNMSVNVAAGAAVVPGTETALADQSYLLYSDGAANLSIAAAHASLPRRDIVVARIRDKDASGAVYQASVEVVTGTAAASPVDPATPPNSVVLARVVVFAAATSITAANILDLRSAARSRASEVPHVEVARYQPGAGISSSSSGFAAVPSAPTLTVGKVRADTKVVLHVDACLFKATSVGTVSLALQIDGVDQECAALPIDAVSTYRTLSGGVAVTGLPAGSYTVTLRWRTTAGTVNADGGARFTYSATETF